MYIGDRYSLITTTMGRTSVTVLILLFPFSLTTCRARNIYEIPSEYRPNALSVQSGNAPRIAVTASAESFDSRQPRHPSRGPALINLLILLL